MTVNGAGRKARVLPAVLAALGVIGFLALGIWQLERRVWKLALIDRVDHRVHAPPIPAPGTADWPHITRRADEYLHVQLNGQFLPPQTRVQAVTVLGPGFWLMQPFRTKAGDTVLVNRGFTPPDWHGTPPAASSVTGLLRLTEPHGGFLRRNNPAQDRWYSRDTHAIANAEGVAPAAPYFIDADAGPDPTALPRGGLTVIAFPNSHLVYALTWFALALLLAGGTIFGMLTEHPQGDKTE